jgi:hypothetical protein
MLKKGTLAVCPVTRGRAMGSGDRARGGGGSAALKRFSHRIQSQVESSIDPRASDLEEQLGRSEADRQGASVEIAENVVEDVRVSGEHLGGAVA